MATDEKWYFTKEQLANTPSRKCGIDADKELSYRQQAANFIQDMGQRLVVTQLCINTAIVYMHRFYVFHSLSQFHRNSIAAAALFLAAKVEEQPRKLEHVIKVAHMCLHRGDTNPPDVKSEAYLEQAQDLVFNENVLLQTLGFDVAIDHPHTHVVRCCHLVKASKDLAQTSYFMASNSLHLTTMCLQYKPTVVACFCIHLACKWSNWEIPQSNEGKSWFWYVDHTVTAELLQQLTAEFLHIFDKCPSRLKKKIMSISEKQSPNMHHPSLPNSPFDAEPRKVQSPAADSGPTFQSARPFPTEEDKKKSSNLPPTRPPVDYREYREKKERERLEREKIALASGSSSSQPHSQDIKHHSSHHHKQPSSSAPSTVVPTSSASNKNLPLPSQKTNIHHNHHHRPDMKLQPSSQRHSTSSQARDPARDASRQRVPRDYKSGQAPTAVPYSHNHPGSHSKDGNVISENSSNEMLPVLPESSQPHQNPAEKVNNNHNVHRLVQHDKRFYDSRHKLIDHRKDERKNYPKYGEQVRNDKPKKPPDSLEQRSEEVRKLIEKPLPLPKPRAEIQKEEYIASMLKQSHHPAPNKYNLEIPVSSSNSNRNTFPPKGMMKLQPVFPGTVSQQHPHNVTQILKDTKNGTSNINMNSNVGNVDEKVDKRVKPEETVTQVPPVRHKSIFSPVKMPNSSESTPSNRSKVGRQKTPPISTKSIKPERSSEIPQGLNMICSPPFSSPSLSQLQLSSNLAQHTPINSKRNHMPHLGDPEPPAKVKLDELDCLSMKSLSDFSEPPIDLKFDPLESFDSELSSSKSILTNGLDAINLNSQKSDSEKLDNSSINMKVEYLSPMKSAQSISALLAEPLAPMPSLLQNLSDDSGNFSQCTDNYSVPSQNLTQPSEPRAQVMTNSVNAEPHIDESFVLSTVDISALSAPVQTVPEVPIVVNSQSDIKLKVEHHKSEKKKKKDKHKHKDKDKSKEKHKHKHKDKDREKHRDKEKDKDRSKDKEKEKESNKEREKFDDNATAPIKITIPKDKLNLSSDSSISQDKKSPQNTGLKIKIPKERLKGSESSVTPVLRDAQAPLKIKIRTNAALSQDYNTDNRKRERDTSLDTSVSAPPAKKLQLSSVNQTPNQLSQQLLQQMQQHQQHARPNERQNGRHYNSSSNNKDKHSSREYKSSSKFSQSQQSHPT
ncbi:cyclin-T isoform X2 [Chelonus insularis]|uniref:cyclin-T isoform X2 n=1 Tax=Chelonus insularis TaxID=460826 RepID=UPI00158BD052|nr:cyclin-T isoform X2 [Chelonus insularis]